ncbi:MAG: hypothetical protein R3E42_13545 [Burkholderiaceae bacterium]
MLYPQDLIYLAGLLVISALPLFFVTTLAGRLWRASCSPANRVHRAVPLDRTPPRR